MVRFAVLSRLLGFVQRLMSRFKDYHYEVKCIFLGNCSTYCEQGMRPLRAYAQKERI